MGVRDEEQRRLAASGTRPSLNLLKVVMGIDPQEGGPTEVVLTTTAGEVEAGMSVTVASPSTGSAGERSNVEYLRSVGAEVVLFPLRASGLARRWALCPALLLWLRRYVRRFDAVHIHGAWGLVPVAALGLVRITQVPTVLTVHEALTDYDVHETARRYLIPAKRIGRRLILAMAGNVVVSSDLERRDTAPSRSRVVVIPHPVASRAASPPPRSRGPSSTIGFIGRFHEKKNLPLLLEALTRVPNIDLIVAGYGSEGVVTELQALANKLGVSRRVTWLGWIGPDERVEFYQRIDVLAMPSAYECYGMVAAEAMANGTPVVVSETTGAAELVLASEGGLVTSRDAADLATALARLLSDPELREATALRAARFAAERLTPRKYGDAVLNLYRSSATQVDWPDVKRRDPMGRLKDNMGRSAYGHVARLVGTDSSRKSRFHTARGEVPPPAAWRRLPVEMYRRFARRSDRRPWMTPEAVAYLSDSVTVGTKILEVGSGNSTLWYAGNGASVLSVETDEVWHGSIVAQVSDGNYVECEVVHVAASRLNQYLRGLPEYEFDVVIVDHSEAGGATRLDSLRAVKNTVRRGGVLCLDDSDRPENWDAQALLPGWSCVRLTGLKGKPLLAIETSVFTRPPEGAPSS